MWTCGSLRAFLLVAVAHSLRALAGDDCNRNGVDDALDIRARTSQDCNRNSVPDECDLAPLQLAFEPARRFRVVGTARESLDGAVLGDFNGDTRPDLVIEVGGRLAVLLNAGGGELSDPKPVVTPLSGVNGLVASDLNGDGKLDLAVGELNQGSMIHILLGNGDGTFQKRRSTSFAREGATGNIVAADLDGDADIDLVYSDYDYSHGITLFQNTGQGDFHVWSLQPWSPASIAMFLLAGDVDGDRDVDFLVPDAGGVGLLLFRNQGDATFDAEPQRDDTTFLLPPMSGDFDGDRDLDLLAGEGDLFRNLGDGTFDAPRATELSLIPGFSYSGVAADVDRDGDLDLVLPASAVGPFRNKEVILLARNRGDGTFPPPETIPAETSARPIAVADLNGDGLPDIVALAPLTGRLLVLLGRGTRAPASPDVNGNRIPDECEPDCDRDGVPDSHAVAVGKARDCNLNGIPDACDVQAEVRFETGECVVTGGALGSLAMSDLDGNGTLDFAFLRRPIIFKTDTWLEIYLNPGDGTFVAGQELDFDRPPHFIAAGDFNGDGSPDLFGTQGIDGSVLLLLNDTSGAFLLAGEFPAGKFPHKVNALDLDGDSRVDLLVESNVNDASTATILINQGGKTFSTQRTFKTRGRVAAIADLDSSGAPDLVTDHPTGSVFVTWNDGSAVFLDPRKLAEGTLLAAADLDGDQDIDLAIDDRLEAKSFVLLNHGDGNFERADLTRDPRVFGFIVFDADGDKDVDLVVGRTSGPQLAVLPGNGRGAFGPPLVLEGMPVLAWQLLPADLDQDGLSDLVAVGGGGCPLSTFLNRTPPPKSKDQNSDGVPDECGVPSGGQLPSDATQDGTLDISDAVWVLRWLFQGAASPWPCDGGRNEDPGPADVRLLDSTGDGALDISDPIALLGYLFLPGSPPPTLGTRCVALSGCPDRCAP